MKETKTVIKRLLFAVSDGILDDLARLSILRAAKTYQNVAGEIILASYESLVPEDDPIFNMIKEVGSNVQVRTLEVSREQLEKYVPRVMNEKFDLGISHWDSALESKQYLANFSDLIIYYMMMEYVDDQIIYMDSDIIPLQPLVADLWVLSNDIGKNGSLYINANFIVIPAGEADIKKRWLNMIDGPYLDKYHHRYDGVGPVAFDKFFSRHEDLRGFQQHVLPPKAMNKISYDEMYKAAKVAINAGSAIVIDVIHDGPMINIPRSAIQAALTALNKEEVAMGLRVTHPEVGILEYVLEFRKKGIKGVHFYE